MSDENTVQRGAPLAPRLLAASERMAQWRMQRFRALRAELNALEANPWHHASSVLAAPQERVLRADVLRAVLLTVPEVLEAPGERRALREEAAQAQAEALEGFDGGGDPPIWDAGLLRQLRRLGAERAGPAEALRLLAVDALWFAASFQEAWYEARLTRAEAAASLLGRWFPGGTGLALRPPTTAAPPAAASRPPSRGPMARSDETADWDEPQDGAPAPMLLALVEEIPALAEAAGLPEPRRGSLTDELLALLLLSQDRVSAGWDDRVAAFRGHWIAHLGADPAAVGRRLLAEPGPQGLEGAVLPTAEMERGRLRRMKRELGGRRIRARLYGLEARDAGRRSAQIEVLRGAIERLM